MASFTRQNQSRHKLAAISSDKKISSLDLMPFVGCFGRTQDERLKTAVAIQAVPNVIDTLIATILGPFGDYQLITALNALHPETGTFGYYRHGNLAAFASSATR
jgi:hypothetical protein